MVSVNSNTVYEDVKKNSQYSKTKLAIIIGIMHVVVFGLAYGIEITLEGAERRRAFKLSNMVLEGNIRRSSYDISQHCRGSDNIVDVSTFCEIDDAPEVLENAFSRINWVKDAPEILEYSISDVPKVLECNINDVS